jgi:D-glycero-alpha-D-manno-heptose-7-phosphate kinase
MDLAGGTLDIWPLYLFEGEGMTVNAALDLYSTVSAETRSDSEIHLISEDTGDRLIAPDFESLPVGETLDLVCRALKFYKPPSGVTVTTHSRAPKGSGLGASSSLLINLSHVLNAVNQGGLTHERIIDVAANLEAQCIGIPTGKQDYYPPSYGGVNAIWFQPGGNKVEPLGGDNLCQELESRIILTYTGMTHFSGTNNWAMMKRYIDNSGTTVQNLRRIKETAFRMRDALLARDFGRFAVLVDEEWQNRKDLAKGVTNARIDRMVDAAREAGALATKICGAGGGGCMITVVEPAKRAEVEAALTGAKAKVMSYRIPRQGVTLTTT